MASPSVLFSSLPFTCAEIPCNLVAGLLSVFLPGKGSWLRAGALPALLTSESPRPRVVPDTGGTQSLIGMNE